MWESVEGGSGRGSCTDGPGGGSPVELEQVCVIEPENLGPGSRGC